MAFPGFFLAFPYVGKIQESQEFYPGIPGNSLLFFAMVYESIDHGNDVTCHAVPVVLLLVFLKKNRM